MPVELAGKVGGAWRGNGVTAGFVSWVVLGLLLS
jgi:hypothetical protein